MMHNKNLSKFTSLRTKQKHSENIVQADGVHLLDNIQKDAKFEIKQKDREQSVDGLSHFLADTYFLYLKTQNFHWNVTGERFLSLHLLFEQQYKELAEAIDTIAERIRTLGFSTPATFAEFMELSHINEERGVSNAETMISRLVEANETLILSARKLYKIVDELNDEATADLLTQRIRTHEKATWMLRSVLDS